MPSTAPHTHNARCRSARPIAEVTNCHNGTVSYYYCPLEMAAGLEFMKELGWPFMIKDRP